MSLRVGMAAIGRLKQGPERELLARYLERAGAAGRSLGFTGFLVSEFSESRNAAAAARKTEEAKLLSGTIDEDGAAVALDEHGRGLSSQDFARQLAGWRDSGRSSVTFLIGGADGLDKALVSRAGLVLSLSALTWPHQLVRVMLAEQLYRAMTILSGHPYHRE